MTDLQLLKDSFNRIGLYFTFEPTLIGATVSIYSSLTVTDFEFDEHGKFLRIISYGKSKTL